MDGKLLRLRLSRPLVYAADTTGDEWIEGYDLSGSMYEDDEGPHARSPLPRPLFIGSALTQDDCGIADATRNVQATGLDPGRHRFVIGTEVIAIAQYESGASPETCLNAFLRDAWWAGISLSGPLVLRRIREDGKEALQCLSPAVFPERNEG